MEQSPIGRQTANDHRDRGFDNGQEGGQGADNGAVRKRRGVADKEDGAGDIDGHNEKSETEGSGENELLEKPDLQHTEFEERESHDRQVGEYIRDAAVNGSIMEEGGARGRLAGFWIPQGSSLAMIPRTAADGQILEIVQSLSQLYGTFAASGVGMTSDPYNCSHPPCE